MTAAQYNKIRNNIETVMARAAATQRLEFPDGPDEAVRDTLRKLDASYEAQLAELDKYRAEIHRRAAGQLEICFPSLVKG